MANYEHLPIFKSCYDLLIESYKATKTFAKEYKYTIGEKIKLYVLDLTLLIHNINSVFNKERRKELLEEAINIGERVKLLFRITKDISVLDLKKFARISQMVIEILKQLEGWKNSIK